MKNWEALRQRIKGTLITAQSPDFIAHRDMMVWNEIKPDRIPDVIVTVKNGNVLNKSAKNMIRMDCFLVTWVAFKTKQ